LADGFLLADVLGSERQLVDGNVLANGSCV
jgi:hypothetical protein